MEQPINTTANTLAQSQASPQAAGEFAIRVRDLSKCYLIYDRAQDRLKQSIVPKVRRLVRKSPRNYYREFWALRDVSFEIPKGETVGIIGRNGAGKSTLLQILCGTLHPTSGSVEINGRVAALLELGSGFNPEFSGRENVYLYAGVLGLSRREVDERFDDIAAFADIGAFIDQPIKTYSTGMVVRLAFAVSACVDPDILIVDEALAVGDEAFQRKCFARIEEIQQKGSTILLVSHGAQTVVQLCSRALLIDGGELLLEGRPKTVVGHYQRLVNLTGAEGDSVREEIRQIRVVDSKQSTLPAGPAIQSTMDTLGERDKDPDAAPSKRPSFEDYDPGLFSHSCVEYEQHGARIRDLRLLNGRGKQVNILEMGRRYTYEYFVDFAVEAANVGFGMLINTTNGFGISGATTAYSRALRTCRIARGSSARVRFEFDCRLTPGVYFLNAGVLGTADGQDRYFHRILDGLVFRVTATDELIATSLIDLGYKSSILVSTQKDGKTSIDRATME